VVVPWCFACIPTYSICVDGGDLTSFLLPALCYTVYLCPLFSCPSAYPILLVSPLLLSLCLFHPPWSVETASESPVISGISYGFDPIPLPIRRGFGILPSPSSLLYSLLVSPSSPVPLPIPSSLVSRNCLGISCDKWYILRLRSYPSFYPIF